jgi:phosphoribosylformylglycinamidine synthase
MMKKAGVVVFPGSNCDQDLVEALRISGFEQVVKLWHKQSSLEDCQFIFLPGGFSYGDYLRSGAIARFSPIMNEIIRFANKGGFVMGICNGFQILTEASLLPGALLRNMNRLFICDFVHIKAENRNSMLTKLVPESGSLKIPIAHGEGRYFASQKELDHIEAENQVIFRYSTNDGEITESANPNGSLNNIAGVCNRSGNVFGMMPHPERVSDPRLGGVDGSLLFRGIYQALS